MDIFVRLRAIIATNEPNDFLLGGVKPQLKKSHQPISTRLTSLGDKENSR